ncbi:MAG: hypothetical protein R2731_16305 [Nocardioides sp.]
MDPVELVWLAAFAAIGVLGVWMARARARGLDAQLAWARICAFGLFAALLWVVAADILLSPDHAGAATPMDATIVGWGFVGLGVLMVAFAAAVGVGLRRSRAGRA